MTETTGGGVGSDSGSGSGSAGGSGAGIGTGNGNGIEVAGGSWSLACPRCGRDDQVLGVSAAYLRAKAELREEVGRGEDAKVTTREVHSALGKALAVAPEEPEGGTMGCFGVVLLLVSIGTFIWGAFQGKWFDRDAATRFVPGTGGDVGRFVVDPPMTYLGVISAASLLVGVVLIAVSSRAVRIWRRRTEPGRAAADRVWAEGWYCGRCGTVHLAGERAMTLQEFRIRVWSAGGYGDLAVRHPAI